MASQDDTPQQHPTPKGSAEPGQDRPEQGAGGGRGLSDASETIVSGDHAEGSGSAAADGVSGASADNDGSAAETRNKNLEHDDWDAAFAGAAGTVPEAGQQGASSAGRPAAAEVPESHPTPAQSSALPMRSAGTLPSFSEYEDLPEDGRDGAGNTDPGDTISASKPAGAAAAEPADTEALPVHKTAAAPRVTKDDGTPHTEAAAHTETAPQTAAPTTDSARRNDDAHQTDAAPAAPVSSSVAVPVSAASAAAPRTAPDSTAPRTAPVSTAPISTAEPRTAATAGAKAPKAASTGKAAAAEIPAATRPRPADDDISEEEVRRRAEERERAGTTKPVLARFLQVMIAVFFPVMLLAAAIRAVATPLFLWAEYHRPGFPADSYGFTTDDRVTYGSYAVDYLLNFSGARYLGDLVTAGGEPLYLESEVSHMADVKTVLTVAFVTALVMAVLSLLGCLYLAKRRPGGIRRALFSGSVATLVLVGGLIVLAVMGWESFFTEVHSIFFANGNWTFRMDDTLIRLFPAQFWMDAGIVIASLVLVVCIVVMIAAWPTKARRERSRRKQEEARRRYLDSLEAV
ncbi:TIGR01906 family membrane protein [Arthrobacter sp. NPDC097144]|uniref:TIGR01906 family membrane protein n=1 Tax=Arthrobacter sp. NPDC097144 TaxID=3363946 RepID=UPI003822325A